MPPFIRSSSSKKSANQVVSCPFSPRLLLALFMLAGSFGLTEQSAIAQTAPPRARVTVNRDANTGEVFVDQNAFDLRTGPLTNESDVPLPGLLPETTIEGRPLPSFVDGELAPNTIDISTDFEFINRSFNEIINQDPDGPNYSLQSDSIRTTTTFDLNYVPGNHNFGEGIRVRVIDENGEVRFDERRFVRGDSVTVGPEGQQLPSSESITVSYDENDQVELSVLNVRDNNAPASESGVYFTRDGQIIAEDLPQGGDRDFDDGEYVDLTGGEGSAVAIERDTLIETDTEESSSPLDPSRREEEIIEEDEIITVTEISEDIVQENRDFGSVELPDNLSNRLGHAVGARTEADELLVYDRYASVGQVRLGSDGVGATGQLRPLIGNPKAPPTLLTGDAVFDPFADDNEAGFSTAVGITQFLTRTHRMATDEFGNEIIPPEDDDTRLLEPTGLFNNRRMVGYVPTSQQIEAVNGILELPSDSAVVVAPPDPTQVGRGDSAYTDNVGGFILERTDGSLTFVPQWTNEGYAQTPTALEPGEVSRIIYALVPQQPGQNLTLGQTYDIDASSATYRIADGGFNVIAADQYPDNFYAETSNVYTVEDTLPTIDNAATAVFNGIRGLYIEPDGEVESTVDPTIPELADARVGNLLLPQIGQQAYSRTTRAAGLYIAGTLAGGIGNQRDTFDEIRTTLRTETDQQRLVVRTNRFETPRNQVVSAITETVTTTEREGTATFDINGEGRLDNVEFESDDEASVIDTDTRTFEPEERIDLAEELLVDSNSVETIEPLDPEVEPRITPIDSDSSRRSDSYANASPIRGELALGGVFNFGNTPWTPAANTVRAELFGRDTVIGRGGDGSEVGWRAAAVFHPFGEKRREAYQYDQTGAVTAIYQTEPVLDASGNQVVEVLTAPDGETVEMPVNRFVLDENGDRIPQTAGTGRSKGPGVYLRVEDAFDDGESVAFDGGFQFTF